MIHQKGRPAEPPDILYTKIWIYRPLWVCSGQERDPALRPGAG